MNRHKIELIAQADLLLLVADLFRHPAAIKQPINNLDKSEIESLVSATGLQEPSGLVQHLKKTIDHVRDTSPNEWSYCYRALFDGHIVCPINEAGFIRRDKGAIIGDVCGFYRAFGWNPTSDSGERPDHLLVELEFVAMLLVMEANALTEEQRDVTQSALADFTQAHLNDWTMAFCDQLARSTSHPLFLAAAELLACVWQSLITHHGWIVDPSPASTVGICDEPDDPYECGAPDLVTLDSAQ